MGTALVERCGSALDGCARQFQATCKFVHGIVSLVKIVASRLTHARLCGTHCMQAYLGVFTGGVIFIMSSFGGSVALRPPICGDLFGIKVYLPLSLSPGCSPKHLRQQLGLLAAGLRVCGCVRS